VVFSALGFMMRRHGWPRAPLLLGVVLGTKMELYLWLSYTRYGTDWMLRPGVVALFVLLLASVFYPVWQNRRRAAVMEAQ
jgi:TctA family transporter